MAMQVVVVTSVMLLGAVRVMAKGSEGSRPSYFRLLSSGAEQAALASATQERGYALCGELVVPGRISAADAVREG